MPELPEVEVCRLGISPHVLEQKINQVVVRQPQLRWAIPEQIQQACGQNVKAVQRRSKYLLLILANGTILLHLGMSGTVRVLPSNTPAVKHDHFELHFDNNKMLRLNDPRRFGAVLWLEQGID